MRQRRYKTTADFVGACLRFIDCLADRRTHDPEDLRNFVRIEAALNAAFAVAVDQVRASGCGDPEIARVLGVSKQAVGQRWPRGSA
jgi:DNA-directed RNA polymerase specialized sigma24 family protein